MYHINRCLNSRLATICQKAIELESLNAKLINYLPENLRDHFCVSSFNNGCLLLSTHDPVWASQLRYNLPEIRDKLRSQEKLYQLISIKIKISMPELKRSTSVRARICLSAVAKETILESSSECSYKPLQDALNKLAGVNDKK